MTTSDRQLGDFSGLAADYAASRPDYSRTVLNAVASLLPRPVEHCDVVDCGAGTGIWTRMLSSLGPRSLTAIEPNEDMRSEGIRFTADEDITWRSGTGDATGLPDGSADWICMASSFHWVNTAAALTEFQRVLRPDGLFTALWNPRLIEANPLLMEIEDEIKDVRPDVTRVSSGRSGITNTLTDTLFASGQFDDVIYIEGRHVINMPRERYIAAWRSVNDLRVQLGDTGFARFMARVEEIVADVDMIEATYLTRSWTARCKKQ